MPEAKPLTTTDIDPNPASHRPSAGALGNAIQRRQQGGTGGERPRTERAAPRATPAKPVRERMVRVEFQVSADVAQEISNALYTLGRKTGQQVLRAELYEAMTEMFMSRIVPAIDRMPDASVQRTRPWSGDPDSKGLVTARVVTLLNEAMDIASQTDAE